MTDRKSIIEALSAANCDWHLLLVAADFFAETGEAEFEKALRWMAKWKRWPLRKDTGDEEDYDYMWTCFGGLCGPIFRCGTEHTLPRKLCNRMKFWEWQIKHSWEEAVGALAAALAQGDVDCVGDPLKAEAAV